MSYVWRINSPYSNSVSLAALPKILSVPMRLKAKLLGHKHEGNYNIGVFGNSRSIMLSSSHFSLKDHKDFFNFSVGGTSFPQSVRAIEYLADRGQLPSTIIISLDNRNLQFDGFIYWPNPSTDIIKFISDLKICFSSSEASFKRCGKLATYYIYFASKQFNQLWSQENYKVYFDYLWPNKASQKHVGLRRLDGSRVQDTHHSDDESRYNIQKVMSSVAIDYQVLGIETLVEIAKREKQKIFIFESPISPKYRNFLNAHQEEHGETLWHEISRKCDSVFVYCFEDEMKTQKSWPDCCHAPAQPWADYIVSRLKGEGFLNDF